MIRPTTLTKAQEAVVTANTDRSHFAADYLLGQWASSSLRSCNATLALQDYNGEGRSSATSSRATSRATSRAPSRAISECGLTMRYEQWVSLLMDHNHAVFCDVEHMLLTCERKQATSVLMEVFEAFDVAQEMAEGVLDFAYAQPEPRTTTDHGVDGAVEDFQLGGVRAAADDGAGTRART